MDLGELNAFVKTLVLPPTGPLILGVLGLLLTRSRRFRTGGLFACAVSLATLWLLSTPVVVSQLMKWPGSYPALDLRRPVDAQAVVILAGGVRRYAPEYNDDAPNEITLQRVVYGARVARVTSLPVLVTGGRGEARVMADFLGKDFGIPPRWIEDRSRDTGENAKFSVPMLKAAGVTRVVLVTSALHMSRAVSEFRAQNINVIPAPVSLYSPRQGLFSKWVPGVAGMRDSYNVLYEVLADVKRRMRRG